MTLGFISAYGGGRVDAYPPQPTGDDDEDDEREDVDRGYEREPEDWQPLDLMMPAGWRPRDWPLCPVRFVDGKDEGEIVTCPTSPQGHPVPVRLSEIGAVVMRIDDGECKRDFAAVERVVSMVAGVFPWHEVEAFAAGLQEAGLRLLIAQPPGGRPSYDYEKMRKAAQNRSLDEMGILEEVAVAGDSDVPTVVDGRLEPRVGGFDSSRSPVFGVIKSHREIYLHPVGMQVLYRLEPGQRTPAFALLAGEGRRLPVVSWYVRLAGGSGSMPSWGYVRVEAALRWFEDQQAMDFGVIDRLSETIFRYRCRQRSYGRAPVSLHPVVRGEESLGALFTPIGALTSRFYRLNGL
jgi:hypothetical protein